MVTVLHNTTKQSHDPLLLWTGPSLIIQVHAGLTRDTTLLVMTPPNRVFTVFFCNKQTNKQTRVSRLAG